jgi:electron transfer flavoprotein beta subunit
MKLAICAKVVPAARHSRRVDPDSGRMVRDAGTLSELDRHAVEEALQLRGRIEVEEIVIISMAPAASVAAVRDALAMGVDRAIVVADDAIRGSDMLATSRVLAKVLERETPDLVLFGPQGEESTGAMLWAAVAARLHLPVLAQADAVLVEGAEVRATRQTETGYETVAAEMPCVVGVTGSINQPRLVPVKGKITARNKPLELIGLADLGLAPDQVGEAGSGTTVISVGPPPSRGEPQVLKDEDDLAEQIYAFLRQKALVG